MKHFAITALSLFICTYAHANQPTHHAYTNTIIAHNISNIQHSITQNTFNAFAIYSNKKNTKSSQKNSPDLYGHAPIYGSELMYGEFNDDGTMGRNGGDTPIATLSNIWLNWQHTDNKIKFDNHSPIKNRNDLIIAGLSGNTTYIGPVEHNWGINTGYTNSELYNNLHIDSNGGFLGIYNGFKYNQLITKTHISAGASDNTADSIFGSDSFTNFWFSSTISTSYTIALDKTFSLQPVLGAEYTWIKSKDYTSVSGDTIKNDNFNIFKVTPGFHAIKHIANEWYGTMNLLYIMTFANGGDITLNNTDISNLNNTKHFEYGISITKNIYNTNIHATIGRQDGDIYGWFGNINIKYIF